MEWKGRRRRKFNGKGRRERIFLYISPFYFSERRKHRKKEEETKKKTCLNGRCPNRCFSVAMGTKPRKRRRSRLLQFSSSFTLVDHFFIFWSTFQSRERVEMKFFFIKDFYAQLMDVYGLQSRRKKKEKFMNFGRNRNRRVFLNSNKRDAKVNKNLGKFSFGVL